MTGGRGALDTFREAAVEWAAGGRGRPLVDAAAEALAAGLDSPTLRVLAGAPRAWADEEATEFAPAVFEELGLPVAERLSTDAIVEGARQTARQFLVERVAPRTIARSISRMYVAAGWPDELAVWPGLDDWYDMLEDGVISGRLEEVDAATIEAAQLLAERRPAPPVSLGSPFVVERPTSRSRVARRLRRHRRAP